MRNILERLRPKINVSALKIYPTNENAPAFQKTWCTLQDLAPWQKRGVSTPKPMHELTGTIRPTGLAKMLALTRVRMWGKFWTRTLRDLARLSSTLKPRGEAHFSYFIVLHLLGNDFVNSFRVLQKWKGSCEILSNSWKHPSWSHAFKLRSLHSIFPKKLPRLGFK